MTAPSQPEPLVLRAPRLLDGSGDAAVPDAALWLDGGRIAWVGPTAALLGDPDRGALRPGAIADVLAVHGDVVLDVSALTRPAAVFKSGRQVR